MSELWLRQGAWPMGAGPWPVLSQARELTSIIRLIEVPE